MKTTVDSHILMLGDAAGNIAPLSGNGISMAPRSASLANATIIKFLDKKISREQMEADYTIITVRRFPPESDMPDWFIRHLASRC
jgi:flavin-dependent dehydrogenase